MRVLLAAAMAVAMAGSSAHAQAPGAPAPSEDKVTEASTALAVGLPVLGFALEIAGVVAEPLDRRNRVLEIGAATMILGPAASHWYTHHVGGAGVAIRTAATAVLLFGAMWLNPEADCDFTSCASLEREERIGFGMLVAGLATITWTIVHDVRTSRREVAEWNRGHPITIAPTALATPSGSSFGLAIGGRF